jgi:mannose-6-phosphate isomerase-like protein (cupin superfamily)
MMIKRLSVMPFDFEGLEIRDYTDDRECSSSVAEITVPAGVRHRRAWSKRSDKYYYGLQGKLSFTIGDSLVELACGDVCIIPKGSRFSYENSTDEVARILLFHTPGFNLSQEVFEEPRDVGTG